jgi:F-type H+-transporting ATPase subunit b
MDSITGQLGELFLQAVPTVLIILIFYLVLRATFFKPLMKVMGERDERTVGAQKAAERAQVTAAEKKKQYEEALKQARAKVYSEQEVARKRALEERAETVKEARTKASSRVTVAKQRIEGELVAARKDIEATVEQLSEEIARRILQTPRRPSGPARGAR